MTPIGMESKPVSCDETVYVYKIEKVKKAVAVVCALAIVLVNFALPTRLTVLDREE